MTKSDLFLLIFLYFSRLRGEGVEGVLRGERRGGRGIKRGEIRDKPINLFSYINEVLGGDSVGLKGTA